MKATKVRKTKFDRDAMAQWYVEQHFKTDPGLVEVHYLPTGAGEREIRLIEVNYLIGEYDDDALEPIDFGVDAGLDSAHQLFMLDVTPKQWDRICEGKLRLPANWSLEGEVVYKNEQLSGPVVATGQV